MENVLASKAVLASLSISRWGARKLDKSVTNEVHARHHTSDDAGRYNKRLVATEALAPIVATISAARGYHYQHTMPWMDDGARILPSAMFLEYSEKMRELRRGFEKASADFIAVYPDVIADAKIRLNGLFRQSDYPRDVSRHFAFDLTILPCPDTQDFRIALDDDAADDVRRDVEKRMATTYENALKDTAQRILETVGHVSERLKAYKPAKGKRDKTEGAFRDSLIGNVRELATLLPAFNLSNDPTFAAIIERITTDLCPIDPDDLRDDAKLRARVATDADAVLRAVAEFIS